MNGFVLMIQIAALLHHWSTAAVQLEEATYRRITDVSLTVVLQCPRLID